MYRLAGTGGCARTASTRAGCPRRLRRLRKPERPTVIASAWERGGIHEGVRDERVLETNRVDPTPMTTHTFSFDEMPRAFEVSDRKLDNTMKVLVSF